MSRCIERQHGVFFRRERPDITFPAKAVALPAMNEENFFISVTPFIRLDRNTLNFKLTLLCGVEKRAVIVSQWRCKWRTKQIKRLAPGGPGCDPSQHIQ